MPNRDAASDLRTPSGALFEILASHLRRPCATGVSGVGRRKQAQLHGPFKLPGGHFRPRRQALNARPQLFLSAPNCTGSRGLYLGRIKDMPGPQFVTIGKIQSPFREKFGVPRQSGLLQQVVSILQLDPKVVDPGALEGLEQCSHLWVISIFHELPPPLRAQRVRPPRLGGNTRIGVYATRSPFRPNRLGLSLAKIRKIDGLDLHLQGLDLVDQSPVIDIKPYVAYCDRRLDSHCWADEAPTALAVRPSPELFARLEQDAELSALWPQIEDFLRWDPRPAYQESKENRVYRCRFGPGEVAFFVNEAGDIVVTEIPETLRGA